MLALFQLFFKICLFRARPQDLPAQPVALWIGLLAALLSGAAGLLSLYSFGGAIARVAAGLVVTAGFLFLVLKLQDKQPRFGQALCALCGSSAIVYLLALPLMPQLVPVSGQAYAPSVVLILLALDVWMLLINAHIFRHTLDVSFGRGLSMALFLTIATLMVIAQFPDPYGQSVADTSSQTAS